MSGDDAATPLDRVLFLARAESRVEILELLVDSNAATQRQLRARADASRTTVSRSLQSLTERGWVENSEGEYRLTRAGELIATSFLELLGTVEQVDELGEFLRWFPTDVDPPNVLGASGLEVTASTEADPYAPARTQTEILRNADHLRVLLPAIEIESTKTLAEQVTGRGLTLETVITPSLEPTIESPKFAPPMREVLRTEGVDLFVAEDPLPFYLGLAADGRVQIGLADDEGFPRALLETTDQDIRAWADDMYQRHHESARRKPADEL